VLSMKWIQGVVVISLLMLLSACGGSGGSSGNDTPTNAAPLIDSVTADSTSVDLGASVTFSWSITDAESDMLSCDLDIDNDGTADYIIDDCANNTSQAHTYDQAGDYQIRLMVTDSVNEPVQQNVNVAVIDPRGISAPEITIFSATPEAPKTSNSVTFDWGVDDADGDTLACKLDVDGDGADDYTINDCVSNTSQAHTYTQAGVYQVRLTVEDGASSPTQTLIDLTVSSTLPVISQFTVDPAPVYSAVESIFYWQVSDPDGDTLTCTLDINDDGTIDYTIDDCANIASQEHTYTSSGDFTARLTVRDSTNETQAPLLVKVKPHLLLDVSVNGPVRAEGRALYTMTVSNVSPQSMDDVSVVYTVPAELQFDAESDAEPNVEGCETTCTDGLEASWALGTLAGGESRTLAINAVVASGVSAGAQIVAPVQATSSSFVDIISVSKAVAVDSNPKSQLAMSASKDPVMPGDNLTLTFDVGNIDSVSLNNLELRAILPAGITVDSISNNGTTDEATGDVVWGVSSLVVGEGFRRTIDVTVSTTAISGEILATRAELSHDGGATLDASAEQAVTVVETVFPIVFDISVTPDPVEAGKSLSYEFTISNVSSVPVDDINVLFRVPPALQFDAITDADPDAEGCGTTCTEGHEASWGLDTLANGESHTITVNALVDGDLPGGSLLTIPVRVTAAGLADDIERLKTVAVTAKVIVGDLELARTSGCLMCHGVDSGLIGPAWKDVADRYRDDANARAILFGSIKNGSNGKWESIMLPNSNVSDADIEALVEFILRL